MPRLGKSWYAEFSVDRSEIYEETKLIGWATKGPMKMYDQDCELRITACVEVLS